MTMTIGDVAIPMAALAFGICMAMDLGTSRASGGIMLATAMACLMPSFIRMLAPIFLMGLAEPVTGPMQFLGFFEVWWVHLPSILFIFLMVFIITKIQKPEKEINGKDYFRQKYAECGKMSVREIKSAIILIFYLTFIIFHDQLFANWNMSWGLAFIPMLFAVPGIGAATAEDLKGINYGFTIFITACMAIGSVADFVRYRQYYRRCYGADARGQRRNGFLHDYLGYVSCVKLCHDAFGDAGCIYPAFDQFGDDFGNQSDGVVLLHVACVRPGYFPL